MQDLLNRLQPPIMIGLIIAVVIVLAVVVVLARRFRKGQTSVDEALGSSMDAPRDYTSLPLEEEPQGWRERFNRLSLAGKILAVLVPLILVLVVFAIVMTLLPSGEPVALPPTPIPVTIRVKDAALIRPEPLTMNVSIVTTGLDNGAEVTIEMLEDGKPFAWINPDHVRGTVRNNRVELQAQRVANAPMPTQGHSYTMVARSADGTTSEATELVIPTINGIANSFFGQVAAVTPTVTRAPTVTPAPPGPTATPAATPTPKLPEGQSATVATGGNLRRLPIMLDNNVIGGINGGEQIALIERTPNGEWYRVRTVRNELGWVSAGLISVPPGIVVPVAKVVTVFVNGAVYERADSASTEVDRVNQGEVVVLLQRTKAGDWYQLTNVRDITGWVPVSLLGIPDEIPGLVPVTP